MCCYSAQTLAAKPSVEVTSSARALASLSGPRGYPGSRARAVGWELRGLQSPGCPGTFRQTLAPRPLESDRVRLTVPVAPKISIVDRFQGHVLVLPKLRFV